MKGQAGARAYTNKVSLGLLGAVVQSPTVACSYNKLGKLYLPLLLYRLLWLSTDKAVVRITEIGRSVAWISHRQHGCGLLAWRGRGSMSWTLNDRILLEMKEEW